MNLADVSNEELIAEFQRRQQRDGAVDLRTQIFVNGIGMNVGRYSLMFLGGPPVPLPEQKA